MTTPTGKHLARGVALAFGWLALPTASEAGTLIDWLNFAPGADRNHFSLVNDLGQPFAQAEITIAAGALAPLSPGGGSLHGDFWGAAPGFTDTILGNETVSTTKVQVAPRAGAVQYQIGIEGADLSGAILAVGQLFGSELDGTRELGLMAKTLSGLIVALEYLGEEPWDNGVRVYTESLDWDGSKLSLSPTATGESGFAFFRIQSGVGPVSEIVFDVPDGYALGSGDALEFALGVPVPEPGMATMGMAAGIALAARRRRCSPNRV